MGGDDLMLPNKITKQVEFMENNPEWHHKKVDKETIKKFELILEK